MPIDTHALSPSPTHSSLGSLYGNSIGDKGATALAAILNQTEITDLKCAATPKGSLSFQRPQTLTQHASPLGSVDGHALQIDELKGTKPTEKINLSKKNLDIASAIIIASCIKENRVLKELKCATPKC